MRQAALAILVAFGLYAAAEEGPLLTPRIRMPGEKAIQPEIVIPSQLLDAWKGKMTDADLDSLKKTLDEVNGKRKGYVKNLEDANKKLEEARKNYNDALSKLDAQQLEVQKLIETRLGADQAKEFAIRAELAPIIDWLKLTDEQVTKIVDKEKALLANDPRAKIVAAARAARELAASGTPSSLEERAKQIDLLTEFMKFNKAWQENVKTELTPEQQKLWDERYRRTQYLIEAPK